MRSTIFIDHGVTMHACYKCLQKYWEIVEMLRLGPPKNVYQLLVIFNFLDNERARELINGYEDIYVLAKELLVLGNISNYLRP